MRRTSILVSLVLTACSAEPTVASTSSKITNADASVGAHPAVVALRTRRDICPEGHQVETFCSGVVVGTRAVVTAAHCLVGREASEIELFFGDDAFKPGRLARVISAKTHPAFNRETRENDLAVLSFTGGPAITPVARGAPGAVADTMELVGFGQTSASGESGVKHFGVSRVRALDTNTLTLEPAPSIACGGDSGGAALVDGKLVGVIRSGDETCAAYSIVTRVDAYEDSFLRAAIAEAEAAPVTNVGEATADRCTETCERDADCPAAMFCLRDRTGAHCGYRGLRAGRFAGACATNADCNGFGCGSYGAGDEQSCRCFVPCGALQTAPAAPPADEGCAMGRSAPRAWLVLPALLVLAVVTRVRRRS